MHFKALCSIPRWAGLTKTILIAMNVTAALLLGVVLQVSASGYGQKITIKVKNAPVEQVFSQIQQQTGFAFICDESLLQQAHPVTVNVTNASIEEVLDACLKGQPLTYTFKNNLVEIRQKNITEQPPVLQSGDMPPPPADVRGRVVDSAGAPLEGASVKVKGTKIAVSTDARGNFELKSPADPDSRLTLVVSYVGYKTREIMVKGLLIRIPDIVLRHSESPLDNVEVVAYGTESRRFSVGSTATVTAAGIEKQPVTNVLLALQGQVPGLEITPSSGAPGAAVRLQIRGQNSLLSSLTSGVKPYDQPLFIIDGVPFAPQNQNSNQLFSFGGSSPYTQYSGMSPFSSINPADIESISVLKDADATSIYGSQGANGVILIVTKKGKPGTTNFDLSANSGVNIVTRNIRLLNTAQYLSLRKEALVNDGVDLSSASPSDYPDLLLFDQTRYTNWPKYYFGKTSNNTDIHASLSGGSASTNFNISAGVTHSNYNFPGNFGDNRLTLHSTVHHSALNSRLNVDLGIDYSYDKNNSSTQPSLALATVLPPNAPDLIDPGGNLVWKYQGVDVSRFQMNGYLRQPSDLQSYTLNSSLRTSYQIISGLRVSANLGYSRFTTTEAQQYPASSQSPEDATSYAIFGNSAAQTINIEPQLDYKHRIGKGEIAALVGGTYKKTTNNSTQMSGYGYTNDAFLGSISLASSVHASSAAEIYKYAASYGRIGYVYDHKYIINLTGRMDGSSNFGPGHRTGKFGSAGLGWILSEEDVFRSALPFISFAKLSGNYGTSGSDGIAPYQYQAFWQPQTSANPFQNVQPLKPTNLFNPDYSWDLKKTLNLSVDLGFLQDRLLVNATWYQSRTGNQLTNYMLPSQTGFTSVLENFNATVQNRGLELTVSSNTIKTTTFSWTTNFNFGLNRNKLLAFPGLATSSYASFYALGRSTSTILGYKYKDVNPTTGIFEFYTGAGGLTSSPNSNVVAKGGDMQPIADMQPSFSGGIGNSVGYKRFSLYFFFQFEKKKGINYLGSIYAQPIPGGPQNDPIQVLDHWSKPGDVSDMQRPTAGYGDAYYAGSYFVRSSGAYSDASYIRLKTVSLSYDLSHSFLKKMALKNGKVYLNAQNLLTITGYKVGDPEMAGQLFNFPLQRTIVGGVSLNF